MNINLISDYTAEELRARFRKGDLPVEIYIVAITRAIMSYLDPDEKLSRPEAAERI